MTSFQYKRIEFLKKCASNCEYTRLGPVDIEILDGKTKECHLENCLACLVYKSELEQVNKTMKSLSKKEIPYDNLFKFKEEYEKHLRIYGYEKQHYISDLYEECFGNKPYVMGMESD